MLDILIVEDNNEIAGLLSAFLRKEGYTVSSAETGEKALRLYEMYGARLLILDINLPGEMDGFAVLSKVREGANTHVLITSARTGKEDQLKGLRIGADEKWYLSEVMKKVGALYGEKTRQIHTEFVMDHYAECMLKGDPERALEVM